MIADVAEKALEGFRLSPQQKRLWNLQQNDPHAYRAQCAVKLEGSLDVNALEDALDQLMRRHEILRTSFRRLPGMNLPLQVISQRRQLMLEQHDISGSSAGNQSRQIETLWKQLSDARWSFDEEPLLRFCLVKQSPTQHSLLVSQSAICNDAAGLRNIVEEISRCYENASQGGTLAEVLVQYADVSQIQNELLEDDETEAGRDYWSKQSLADLHTLKLPFALESGTDHFVTQVLGRAIGVEQVALIDALAERHQTTAAVILMACWQVLLWRLTARTPITVGVSFDGRNYEGLEDAPGLFAKYLPVSSHLRASSPFNVLIDDVEQVIGQHTENQEYFVWENINESEAATGYFPFCFDYEERAESYEAGGVKFSIYRQYVNTERYHVRLSCVRSGEQLRAEFHYDQERYRAADIERLAAQFETLLRSVTANAAARVAELEVMGAAEREQVLVEWNQTEREYGAEQSVVELFEQQSAQRGEAVALVYEDEQLRYAELNERANQVARYLVRLGVGAEVRVGLCVERSLEMIVGVLGILKAGGAYVPLEPQYPRERLEYMLRESGAQVLLTQEQLVASLPVAGVQVVSLDGEWEAIAQESKENLGERARGENVAYVIYTSGSSGRPKGVAVEHRQLLNYVRGIGEVLELGPEASYATVSTLAADLGNTAVYPALCGGGELHVISAERSGDAALLSEYFAQHRIDVLKIVPSHLSALLAGAEGAGVLPQQRLLLGGESTHRELAAQVRGLRPELRGFNHYGPTETTVGVLTHEWAEDEGEEAGATVPLGRPLANTRVYLLDEEQRPVPLGVSGEIYIGGAGVSRGYLERAELTAERFVPDPFSTEGARSTEGGARLYRTGDVGRYLANGELEFLGRVDGQVKLRGYRIELGEIEAALREHDGVREAVVVIREEAGEERRLVGYVVAQRQYLEVLDGRRRYQLPNGLAIVHQNRNETEYMFQEIFTEDNYFKHGISLQPGACVFDVGANIGMFSLLVGQRCPGAKIFAFEPIKEVCALLRLNMELYGSGQVKVFECGLAEVEGTERFSFYPRQSMMSGMSKYADAEYEQEVVKQALQNEQEQREAAAQAVLVAEAEELLAGRFREQGERCRVRRLSTVLRAEGVERIDLLKVDAQRAELDVLRGIEAEDWARIEQVVMEVHDRAGHAEEGRVRAITQLLEGHGFQVATEQEAALFGTDRYSLYATRAAEKVAAPVTEPQIMDQAEPQIVAPLWTAARAGTELQSYLREKLPEYMVPTWVVLLPELPRTANGKIDKRSLPAPEQITSEESVAPRTPTEEIVAGIWAKVLQLEHVDAETSFFALGGHSLLATQVMSRVRAAFGIELHLLSLFESPTVRGLAHQVDLKLEQGRGSTKPPLEKTTRKSQLPLSFAQQRLWFLHQLEPDSAFYNCPATLQLNGSLNVAALERTLLEIIRRHEVLRTSFPAVDGKPVQVIAPSVDFKLAVTDLSARDHVERESAARTLARAEAERPFDLANGPLLRAQLLKLSPEEHVVLFTTHHIVSDGWSMGVLIKEVSALYEAYSHGAESPLPDLTIQYGDYAVWQRAWLRGEVLDQQLGYWREQLRGVPELLELPADKVRPAIQSYRGGRERFSLPLELSEELQALSQKHGATLFMTLLAAWQVLLWRYSGQSDIVVGTPIAGRTQRETEELIGFFVNTLVLRGTVNADANFREYLRHVREVCLGAYAHQDVPFEVVVEELQPARDMSRSPLFQVMFILQNGSPDDLELEGLTSDATGGVTTTTKFDLTLRIVSSAEGLVGACDYSTDLFEATTIKRMLEHWHVMLNAIATDPGAPLATLPLLADSERKQLLVEWNDTAALPSAAAQTVHSLFEAQAALTPDAITIQYADVSVAYGDLNGRANQLAHYLQSVGVGPEVKVGLCLDRSPEMVAGVLAILKAGGVYVPLDPSYPQERLDFMMRDADVKVLLAHDHLLENLPATEAQIVRLPADWSKVAACSVENPASTTTTDNLAYVIYTSGSTGEPKGVMMAHRGIVNHLIWRQSAFPLTSEDRFLHKASISFDISVWEILGTLIAGARLVVAVPGGQQDIPYLVELMASQEVTVAHFGPALLAAILAEPAITRCRKLRRVFCGGEPLTVELQERFFALLPGELVHQYGPTETAVDVAAWACQRESARSVIPIGRPIANTDMYVLDERQQPVPIGIYGELYVGGESLARGYLQRPEITADKFVPHPFGSDAGARLYRTGDIVRYLADGSLEFKGRVDSQVKLRGYRIELGEIEAALQTHGQVREAVVVVGEDEEKGKRLVAYVTPRLDAAQKSWSSETAGAELRSYLRDKLPSYMTPSFLVLLDELPLTANGKVDRKALPAPEQDAAGAEVSLPRTPIEEVLAGIWAEVLGVDEVSVTANFFELGGHSLLATQVMSRVGKAFQIELPVRSLFANPTVRGLASAVQQAMSEGEGLIAPPLTAVTRNGELPLSYAQQRLWFLDQLEPDSAFYNCPGAVRLSGELNVIALEQTLTGVMRRHEVLRTSFPAVEGRPVQVIAPGVEFKLVVTDLSALDDSQRETAARELAQAEGEQPFDLANGPLLRVKLLKLSETEHVVLFTMHHIVSDAWSIGVLIREVSVLYQAYSRGSDSPLPELAIQYADYAAWQRALLQGEVLERQLDYWREQLGGAPELLELPGDKARPAIQTYRGAHHEFSLTPELSKQLNALSRREGTTLFMTLLAAWQVLLWRYSGQSDIVVGTPIAGRTQPETEDLIGLFVNTLVLRTELHADESFADLMRRVREITLEAYAHQDVPFDKLVEELQPERKLSHTPLFQVVLALQNAPSGELQLENLRLSTMSGETRIAKFDLTLVFREKDGALQGVLSYNAELFERETIKRLLTHFERLLTDVTANPEALLSQLRLLTAADQQTLAAWNRTPGPYPQGCIQELFETQVVQAPGAVALVFGEEQISYAELNRRANQLAHYLRRQGVGPDVLVGIMLDRSIELVVALLAILKAGGAYLPLDRESPIERLSYMINDAALPLLLTQEQLLDVLPARYAEVLSDSTQVVCLDTQREEIRQESKSNPASYAGADNLAYVMYTSGTSGQPKAVMVPHRAVIRLVKDTDYVNFSETDVFLQLAPVSFDASTFELWGSLLNGAKLIVMSPESPSLTDLGTALARYGVTTLWLTAGLFHLMVDENLEGLLGVRQLLAGGDVLSPAHVERFLRAAPESVLINGYGPTENTTFSCTYRMDARWQSLGRSVPIGRPIANTQVYVLDETLQPAPVGVAGELYVGGEGLARAYLGTPELTAEKFVPHSQGTEPGARLYRTGDQVRYRSDGTLEFLGRMDQQIKIRGFRVELGEIEAVLDQCRGVAKSVIALSKAANGESRIVAYVVPEDDALVTSKEIFAYLQEKLPAYMVPWAIVRLAELPLTPNGKVDRQALPELGSNQGDEMEEYVTPRTQIEELLTAIWADVLKIEPASINANFFDLGGHSLLVTQVVSRIREAFGIELPVRSLFATPTVRGLAAAVEQELSERQGMVAPPLRAVARNEELPLSYAQQRLWFLDQLEPDSAFYNCPGAVRLSGELNVPALEQTVREIIRRHEVLRTSFPAVAGRPVQVIAPRVEFNLAVTDLSAWESGEAETEARRLAQVEAQTPFDLANGPLLRVKLLKLSETEHVALFTMHHIVSDAWSMGVLIKEVSHLYEVYCHGVEAPLPELPVQYADYAVWQREWLQGEVLERQLEYWREQLQGAPELLALPTDRLRPALQSFVGASEVLLLPAEVATELKSLSRREGMTLFMTLLAGWQTLLYSYSGQEQIVVGTPIANRTRAESEDLIGFFVNTLVLRSDLSGNPSFMELLRRVREVCLGAYTHQDVPFEKLVEELRPERSLSYSPLYQVWFTVHSPTTDIQMGDLQFHEFKVHSLSVKSDMALLATDTAMGLKLVLEYNSDLFDASTVKLVLKTYQALLTTVISRPEVRVAELRTMIDEEVRKQQKAKEKDLEVTDLQILTSIKRKLNREISPKSLS